MKRIVLILFLVSGVIFSQKEKTKKLGKISEEELTMSFYDKDSTASAIVLYEHANVYIDRKNNYNFRTDFYFKIKIFNKNAFDLANIQIPHYKKEKVTGIRAVTYNLENDFIRRSFLEKDKIFKTQNNEFWGETRFTMPNIKEGSVIEYVYSVITPYSRLDDWYFQGDIPKIKSEYDAAILGNYKYNTRLIGFLKLDKNKPSVNKKCIYIDGIGNGACSVISFGMYDVPAFKEEDYMLSKNNFIARVAFDLISYTEVDGTVRKYTKTWKDADKTLRTRFLDGQTTKKGYFKKKLPEKILLEKDELTKAKKTFYFISNKLNWNKKYWTKEKLKIKEVFQEGTGSVDAINLILYNSLQAIGVESYLVASSTRSNGLPTKLYPMVNDFNYILVKAVINNKTYFLDATDKNLAFGQIPFKCINGDGRVLDFKKGSYWESIYPDINSSINVRAKLSFNEDQNFVGSMFIVKKGYNAVAERNKFKNKTKDEYLDDFETTYPYLEVEDYNVENKNQVEKPLKQKFDILIENDDNFEKIRINPFLYSKTTKNPFTLKERKYPVDYGYPRNYTYAIKFNIPKNYSVTKLPKNKAISLPNKGGRFILRVNKLDDQINIYLKQVISKKVYSTDEYYYLKEFYNQIIEEEKSIIQLEKIK